MKQETRLYLSLALPLNNFCNVSFFHRFYFFLNTLYSYVQYMIIQTLIYVHRHCSPEIHAILNIA